MLEAAVAAAAAAGANALLVPRPNEISGCGGEQTCTVVVVAIIIIIIITVIIIIIIITTMIGTTIITHRSYLPTRSGQVVKASASRAEDLGSIPAFAEDTFLVQPYQ